MRRFLFALPAAAIVSYGLIGVMAWMVDLNTRERVQEKPALMFDIFVEDGEESSKRKNRVLPERPEPEPEPPEPSEIGPQVNQVMTTPSLEPVPHLNMDLSVSGISVSVPAPEVKLPAENKAQPAPELAPVQIGQTQQLMPLHRTEPVYPRKALQRKIEGYVVLSFDISESGRPENISVEEAQPARVFNREAVRALRSWRYQPMMTDGQARTRNGQRVKLEFKIR